MGNGDIPDVAQCISSRSFTIDNNPIDFHYDPKYVAKSSTVKIIKDNKKAKGINFVKIPNKFKNEY